jgi:cobalt-zinc-cadmium efflux system outer membrane protein
VDVLAAQEQLALSVEQVHTPEQTLNSASKHVKLGKVSSLEATRAGIIISNGKIQREQAWTNLEAARKRLAANWGQKMPTFEKVDGVLEDASPIPSLEELSGLISQNPDVARWVKEMEQRSVAVALEKAKRIPDVTLSGGVQQDSDTKNYGYVFGISVPLPVFDLNQGNTLAAQYRLEKAKEESSDAAVKADAALADAYRSLSSSYTQTTTLKKDVLPAAEGVFDAYNKGFRAGKFGFSEVLDVQLTLFETKQRYIESLATYHKSVADVERFIGESLDSAIGYRTIEGAR